MIIEIPYEIYSTIMSSLLDSDVHSADPRYTQARKVLKAAMLNAVSAEMEATEASSTLPALLRRQAS